MVKLSLQAWFLPLRLAGLGGVALGGAIGATGMPGFQQQGIVDPEAYQSSNMPGTRQSIPTLQYR